jgi:hypothetical protein
MHGAWEGAWVTKLELGNGADRPELPIIHRPLCGILLLADLHGIFPIGTVP